MTTDQEAVDAAIVEMTSVEHLEDAVAAWEIDLSDSDGASLEAPSEPVPVVGNE